MSPEELSVWGVQEGKEYPCDMGPKDTSNETDFFICDIRMIPNANFQQLKVMSHSTPVHL